MARKQSSWIRETGRTIVYAVLIALAVRTFAYEPFNIPSGSMIPTLLVGDYLFVSKFSYGYSRHSLPLSFPPFKGRIFGSSPDRGDVVVFKLPRDNKTDYIKRIIGLPGDRIQVRKGLLYLNGRAVDRRPVEGAVELAATENRPVTQYIETLPGGRSYRIDEMNGNGGNLDNTPAYEVPEGHYFAMGDNRDNSSDSRVLGSVGYIPAENLVGRAEFLFFSTNGKARFWEVWYWPWATRFDRLFMPVN